MSITEANIALKDIRSHFPILSQQVHGKTLVYFDNGASTQRPLEVINAVKNYEETIHSNVHRGVHHLSAMATEAMEAARAKVAGFINAAQLSECVFTSGSTHGLNTIANGLAGKLKTGDEVLISAMEHHSNIVPWQMLCERTGAQLKVIKITESGEIDMRSFQDLLSDKTKVVSVVHVSNTLGTINPVKEICRLAKEKGAYTIIDGAQAVAHFKVDVQDIACDFYVFSGHKLFAPTGTGVLYGRYEAMDQLNPLLGGGEMIKSVSFEKTTYNELPFRLEAGTPNIAGNIGLGAAIDFIGRLDWNELHKHEQAMLSRMKDILSRIDNSRLIGQSTNRSGVVSFLIGAIHPFDLGVLLDKMGIAMRTGHHCTEPLMAYFDIPGTVRASFSIYNTLDELDYFEQALTKVLPMLA